MAKSKGWGKVKKAIKRSKPAKIIAKTAKINRPTTIKGIKIPKLATTIKQRDHERAAPNPLTGMIPNAGVATSMWNNIRYKPEGFHYWIDIIKHQIETSGITSVIKNWMSDYFHTSANYEDSNSLYFNTDFRQGDSILDEWEDSTITDMYNEEIDDPNDKAINVEDAIIMSKAAKYLADEGITLDVKAAAEKVKEEVRKLARKGVSIGHAAKAVLGDTSPRSEDSWLMNLVARNEARRVWTERNREAVKKIQERLATERANHPQRDLILPTSDKGFYIPKSKVVQYDKERHRRMAAERAKHPQKYLKLPKSNKGFNVPKGK